MPNGGRGPLLEKITPIAKLRGMQYTYQNIAGEGCVAWNPRNASLAKRENVVREALRNDT